MHEHCVMLSTLPEAHAPFGKIVGNHSQMRPVYIEAKDLAGKLAAARAFRALVCQNPAVAACDSISVDVSDVYELALLPGAALSDSELYTITGSKRPCSAMGIMKEKCLRPASMRMCADCKQMLLVDKFSKHQRAKV